MGVGSGWHPDNPGALSAQSGSADCNLADPDPPAGWLLHISAEVEHSYLIPKHASYTLIDILSLS